FFFSSRRRHTRCLSDWSSDVCSSDLANFRGDRARLLECEFLDERALHACQRRERNVGGDAERERRAENDEDSPACAKGDGGDDRSEERRVGKEVRCRWWPGQ